LRLEVATERVGREKLGQELRQAQEARRVAEGLSQRIPRPRGRPRKVVVAPAPGDPLAGDLPVMPRKRGRPRKVVVAPTLGNPMAGEPLARDPLAGEPLAGNPLASDLPIVPRKRGRPRKVVDLTTEPPAMPRKRGRPRKVPVVEQAALDLPTADAPSRVGRPRKVREPKPVKWWIKGWKPTAGPRA
jgi:hypothetical protein